jgi:NAD(P)-dependent dehydrogenase (short-subunit alcohol dehydrogenase family)
MSKLAVASFTNLGYKLHSRQFSPIVADMTGKTVVVTGSTGGIGLESARSLSKLGARVVIVGRDEQKLASAVESIGGEVLAQQADLSLLAEVRQLADRLMESTHRIDVLINNVGVLLPERLETDEGLEMSFATNLAGHFLLTNLLLPRLAESETTRVINVSSGGMYAARIDPSDLQFRRRRYTGKAAYASSKRGQVILTEMWAERFPERKVAFHSMHPGWARTAGVAESLPVFNKVMQPLLRTAAEGADTIIWLAVAAEPGSRSGRFWFDREEAPTHLTDSTQESAADRAELWAELARVTGADLPVATAHLDQAGSAATTSAIELRSNPGIDIGPQVE